MLKYKLFKRGETCWVRFYINGLEFRRSTGEADEHKAHQRVPQIIEREKKRLSLMQEINFGQLCVRYHNHVKLHKRSWNDDVQMLGVFLRFFKKETLLSDITPLRIEEFTEHLLARRVGDRGITPARANRYLSVLKHMFNLAIDHWEIFEKANPVRKFVFFREKRRERFFSESEIVRLSAAALESSKKGRSAMQKYFFPMFMVALYAGLRLGEIIRLKWSDIRDNYFVVEITKNNRKRFVPIHPVLNEILAALPKGGEYLFDIPHRRPDVIRKVWSSVKEKAGIEPSARFHDLRHTHATILNNLGTDMRTIQEILGHSSLKMVEAYTHTTNEQKMRAIMAINLPALTTGEGPDGVPNLYRKK